MATKKTEKTDKKAPAKKAKATTRKAPAAKKAATKAAPKEKKAPKEPVKMGPRHPRARVLATSQGSKEALAKALAPALTRDDEDTDAVEARLKTASNAQLLRLQRVSETVKQKYGSRDGLIEAIGKSENKTKDKDYLAKLAKLSLPNLLDLAASAERRARA
jgi:hypothetical protein